MTTIHDQVRERFAAASRILIVSHIRPDGDAVGAAAGLGLSLLGAGKDVSIVLSDGVPASLRSIPGSNLIHKHAAGEFDLVVVVDCSDLERTGKALMGMPGPHLNIDHHITNLMFAEINLVEIGSAATSAVITEHLEEWGLKFTGDVASALLSGIVSDTIGFRTSNMTSGVLRLSARLMDLGADLSTLYNQVLVRRPYAAAVYWGLGLSRLDRRGRLVWTSLTLADRAKAEYSGNDDADLVNVLSAIDEADVAVIFVEQHGGHTKVSWRSNPGTDVSQLALQFGGGGHAAASGADISGSLEEVQAAVLEATEDMLNRETQPEDEIVK
jgi:phosphoesterase RecJ-like protein